jgi:osmotically-inducible protein OsmY
MEKTQIKSNQKIREEIYEAIGEESGIDVHVRDGMVRLTGLVDTEESIDFIESAVRQLDGVDDVENELKVKIVQ